MLCGGESTEHQISIQSARNIIAALNKDKYDVSVIYITPVGKWYLLNKVSDFLQQEPEQILKTNAAEPISVVFGDNAKPWQSLRDPKRRFVADCVFPILHGTYGEDGAPQAILELLHLPYVGSDVQSSAICMEKDITKQMLRSADIPTSDWYVIYPDDALAGLYEKLSTQFGKQMFVKPTSLGSSVATQLVKNREEFNSAVKNALRYDERVIVEPRIVGREIECSVLGNGDPRASLPGEIILRHDYYSYEAKYVDPEGATTEVPVKLPSNIIKRIQEIAVKAFKVMHCTGMARVDFFVVGDKDIFVNELNTIPGFTNISLYPKNWEASGLAYSDLLDELINLAMERHNFQRSLLRIYHHE